MVSIKIIYCKLWYKYPVPNTVVNDKILSSIVGDTISFFIMNQPRIVGKEVNNRFTRTYVCFIISLQGIKNANDVTGKGRSEI
jgi:hypothetical protein